LTPAVGAIVNGKGKPKSRGKSPPRRDEDTNAEGYSDSTGSVTFKDNPFAGEFGAMSHAGELLANNSI